MIAAINKDADAPIFPVADNSRVADLQIAVPEIITVLEGLTEAFPAKLKAAEGNHTNLGGVKAPASLTIC